MTAALLALGLLGATAIVASRLQAEVSRLAGNAVLVLEGHPEAANDIDEADAVKLALTKMASNDQSNGELPVAGYRVTSAFHSLGLTRATTRDGRERSSWGTPTDVWVLEFSAASQQGFAHVTAFAVVNARTGDVESYSQNKSN